MTRPSAPTTYHEIAQRQQPDQADPTSEVPRLPATSPWACDPVPPERPTGENIDAVSNVSKVPRRPANGVH
jgi:hypothetical protein